MAMITSTWSKESKPRSLIKCDSTVSWKSKQITIRIETVYLLGGQTNRYNAHQLWTESARNVSLQRKMDGNYEIFQHAAVCNIFQTVRIFESEYLDCVVNLTRS